ncbi:CHASE2 domain-containing protein [Chitinibacter sp. GC72]|uniref:CHASE2 domain-containing protein n=1 Tax=Chitinibacter sp. GC72 TaxID=1526917 RepID=UPI0012F8DC52|nr:CHASE2 domain-containing protein [Chitinibacter sp. GC72]
MPGRLTAFNRTVNRPAPASPHAARWLLIAVSLLLALALGWINGLGRLDQSLMDSSASRQQRAIDPDIVIIAIDDASIAKLGRWPWPRHYHADLLARLQQARAVGLDLILSEADTHHPANDQALAEAMRQHGRVVMPVFLANQGGLGQLTLPLPSLAGSAAQLAHINTELDQDGLVRRVYLQEGHAATPWPHLALSLLDVAGEAPSPLPGQALSSAQRGNSKQWLRNHALQLPLAGPAGTYPRYSYADVLAGKIAPTIWQDKYVLIGATAAGLGDAYPTAMTGPQSLMPGVELIANTLDTLRNRHPLRRAHAWENAALSVVATALALLALQYLRPRQALLAMVLLLALVLAACELMLSRWHIQFAPMSALLMVMLLYPLWSWLRMEAALRYFAQQLDHIRREDPLLASLPQEGAGLDMLDKKMAALSHAVEQLAHLRRFVRDSLDQLADCVLVCDAQGRIILANLAARHELGDDLNLGFNAALEDDFGDGSGQPLRELLASQFSSQSSAQNGQQNMLAHLFAAQAASARVYDQRGRELLLKSVPRHDQAGKPIGWIVSLIDLSLIQAAQRQRDEALDFLSHDMRSPQSAILALLTLHQSAHPEPDAAQATLFARIRNHAQRTLQLADDFVQLARASAAPLNIEQIDLYDLLCETVDQFWEKAQLAGLNINAICQLDNAGQAIYPADRQMLGRALGNLIENALKYGHSQRGIDCSISRQHSGEIVLAVQDYGAGLDPARRDTLLARFGQLGKAQNGVGLGLALVHTVAERHHGQLSIDAQPGAGACFALTLPAL